MVISSKEPTFANTIEPPKLPSHRVVIGIILMAVVSIVAVCLLLIRLHNSAILDAATSNLQNLSLVEKEINQHFFDGLNDLVTGLMSELQQEEINSEKLFYQYDLFDDHLPLILSLQIIDDAGQLVWVSQPESTLDIGDFQTLQTETPSDIPRVNLSQPDDAEALIHISYATYDLDDNLQYIAIATISPQKWSESLLPYTDASDYIEVFVDQDGMILTTVPYDKELLGTQFPLNTLNTLLESAEYPRLMPPWMADGTSMMSLQSVDHSPMSLIIENMNTAQYLQLDSIAGIILIIAVGTILGGITSLILYMYQHRILQVQMTKLYQISHDLYEEVNVRAETEVSLKESEQRYRIVSELVSDYAFSTMINEDGIGIREWLTDSFDELTSYSSKVIGFVPKAEPGTHPDDIERVEADIAQTLAGEETVTEFRWLSPDGNYIWIRVKRHPIWDEEQKRVTRIVGALSNITTEKEAELALRESEDRYRMVTELVSDYAYSTTINEDGTTVREWLTDSFYNLTDYQEEPVGLYSKPEVGTHPEDFARVEADIARTFTGEETVSEYRWLAGDDNYIWIRVKRRPIWDEDHQRVIRIVGAVSIITAEKEAEQALRASEERYRKVTELISDYAFSIIVEEDRTLISNWLTPSYFRLMGYNPEDMRSTASLKRFVHPDDQEMALADLERVLSGETVTSVYRAKTKSGEYIWLSTKRQPVWDDIQQRVVAYYGVARDITAEKEALGALQKSEERYRAVSEIILGYAFSQYIHQDGTREMEWITESIYLMSGYKFEDIVAHGMNPTHPDDVALVEADIARTIAGEETVTEYRTRNKSGEYIWLRVKRIPIWDGDHQRVIRIIGAGNDITVEKEAELALRKSEERYRRVSNILTNFAYEAYVNLDGTTNLEWTLGAINDIPINLNLEARSNQITADFHPDDVSKIYADFHRTIHDNVQTTTEYRVKSEQGGIRWLRSLREPIWDEDEQRVVRILGTLKDITLEKESESALAESQQRYREVTELMSDYALSLMIDDDEIKLNWVVGSLEQITGITPQAVIDDANVLRHITHPDDAPSLGIDLARTLQGDKTTSEYRIYHAKTKGIRWLRVKRQPIWNDDHTGVGRVLVGASDITAQKESEIALRESEERYRMVSQLISDYVFSIKLYDDLSSELEWIAGAYEQITGTSTESISQSNLTQLPNHTHPDDYVRVSEDISRTNYGETTISEYRIINPIDDTIHWLHVVRQPIWDEQGERVIRIIGAVSDVTVRKSIEDALRASEERYRQVTELISDYVYSLTVLPDNRLEMDWFAGSFEKITGMSISSFIVDTPLDMVKGAHPDDYDDAVLKIEETMAGKSTVSEYRITNIIDNQPRWLRVSRFPVVDETTGQVIRIFGAVSDVTAQKFAEMALRDSEERYRMLTHLMTDYAFSIRFEEDGRLYREWLIGDFESIMGYAIPATAYLDNPEGLSEYRANIEMVQAEIEKAKQGKATTAEYRIVNQKDNQPRWIRVTRQPIWNKEHNRVVRYLGAVKDVTLEKEAEQVSREANELRQALEREKSLHALRSRFVSMVTHEFRNPLAAILSSASILDKYDYRLTPESRNEKFERIYGQIRRMTNLLEDLLEVGELEHRALRFSPQRLDMVELIHDLYDELRDSIGVDHNLIIQSNYPRIYTYADVQILRQALANIISNGIKYSPPKTDIITDVVLDGNEIFIHVIDQGMGIPNMDQKDLFEAFYRASNVSTQPGTGLGLLIAKQSIELHKGTITFTSEVGQGTTFTIMLPRIIGKENDT